MRHLANLNDPIHRMIIKLLVDCLAVLYVNYKEKAGRDYHWLAPNNDEILETNPRYKIRW